MTSFAFALPGFSSSGVVRRFGPDAAATTRRPSWLAAPRWLTAAVALVLFAAAPGLPRAEEAAETARLDASDELTGLPVPRGAARVARTSGPVLQELKAAVAADAAAVLAFYRRELARRGWTEDKTGAVDQAAQIRRSFSGAEGAAVLVLTPAADGTTISLVIRASEEVVAARALEAREADRAARGEALADPDVLMSSAAGDTPPIVGRGGGLLRPRADAGMPIPIPETAEAIALDGAAGRLTFTSGATVRALEAFYRTTLKPLGFSEKPAEPRGGAAVLEFVKGGETLLLVFAREPAAVAVTARGNMLKTAAR